MTSPRRRWRALGGVVGPVAFVATWCTLGLRRAGYSPVHDPISRLAAVESPTRWAMTAGFFAFGAGVALYATELGAAVPGRAATGAATTAAATVAVALTPLGSTLGGTAHAAAAGAAYTALAATPLLAAGPLRDRAHASASKASTAVGVVTAAALLASVVAPAGTGLLQRIGLTTGHAWIIASACLLLRRPSR